MIRRIDRLVSDLDRATAFYRDALGFRPVERGPAELAALGLAGSARQTVMRLGGEEIALVCLDAGCAPYPAHSRSNDAWFQHLAIVVRDIDEAYRHLAAFSSWTAIGRDGPQTLPPANGNVRAFKFRDPDGHPLELLWFPRGQGRAVWHRSLPDAVFLGIDHSAIAVSSLWRSLRFYRRLGFSVTARSWNHGPAQSRLDGLPAARVRVTSLRPASSAGPGLELLAYYPSGQLNRLADACAATDWITIDSGRTPGDALRLRDPDGHRLLLA